MNTPPVISLKYLSAFLVSVLLYPVVNATPLEAKRVQPELGASLGFQIYRFETELGSDEVLIVRELTEDHGKVTESEYAAAGNHVRVQYEIVLVDSGAFHPSLRNTYMLRFENLNGYIENKRLSQWGNTAKGSVEIAFSEIDTNAVSHKLTWIGSVEKYSEIVKRWPELPKPRADGWSASRRMVNNDQPGSRK